jgi:hypothetical protein
MASFLMRVDFKGVLGFDRHSSARGLTGVSLHLDKAATASESTTSWDKQSIYFVFINIVG